MILAVFRSRTETLNFASLLRSYRVPCSVINTPRSINVSCGISVKFESLYLDTAKQIMSRRGFSTFAWFWYDIIQMWLYICIF